MRISTLIVKASSRKGVNGMMASMPKLTARVRPAALMARADSGTAVMTACCSGRQHELSAQLRDRGRGADDHVPGELGYQRHADQRETQRRR